jgi:hypothetical protein
MRKADPKSNEEENNGNYYFILKGADDLGYNSGFNRSALPTEEVMASLIEGKQTEAYLKRIRGYRNSTGTELGENSNLDYDPITQYKKQLLEAKKKESQMLAEINELKNYKRIMDRNKSKYNKLEE